MYMENADGNFLNLNRQLEKVGFADTILPMNINPRIWSGLLGVTEAEFSKPDINIKAGVMLIKRITEHLKEFDRSPAKIGSIYNFTGREKVSDIGERIQIIYEKKLWERKSKSPTKN